LRLDACLGSRWMSSISCFSDCRTFLGCDLFSSNFMGLAFMFNMLLPNISHTYIYFTPELLHAVERCFQCCFAGLDYIFLEIIPGQKHTLLLFVFLLQLRNFLTKFFQHRFSLGANSINFHFISHCQFIGVDAFTALHRMR
jgi:hypothetical protein